MKKLVSIVLALALVLLCVGAAMAEDPAKAATVPTKGSVTVNKAAVGETYTLYKVLSASVGAEGEIVYLAPIPDGLSSVFKLNASGNVEKITSVSDDDLFAALKTWAASANEVTHQKATGNSVVFPDLALGYYVVTSTQGSGAAISVTSTAPDAVTYEKNITTPQPVKTVADKDYSIGDTITYTVKFPGANYMGTSGSSDNKIVTKYEISDTLPAFLSNVVVKSVTIGETPYTVGDPAAVPQFENKKFEIPWATQDATTKKWSSLYANGTEVTIVYEAKLTDVVRVGVNNTNTVTVQPYVGTDDDNPPQPWNETWHDDAEVTTYAAALKKVDDTSDQKPLAGAKFTIAGLTATPGEAGVYTVTKYDPADTSITPTELVVNDEGMIYIIGLDSAETLTITETEAPAGYNKLTTTETLTTEEFSTEIYKKDGYREYDEKGNIVSEGESETTNKVTKNLSDLNAKALKIVNNRGTQLPSTGGIGTTIFYILGGLLVVGAAVILVARRKAQD